MTLVALSPLRQQGDVSRILAALPAVLLQGSGASPPIRPLQLCADGGYQLRFRSLEGTPNYGPRQLAIELRKPQVKIDFHQLLR
jgi:hypothetical protein